MLVKEMFLDEISTTKNFQTVGALVAFTLLALNNLLIGIGIFHLEQLVILIRIFRHLWTCLDTRFSFGSIFLDIFFAYVVAWLFTVDATICTDNLRATFSSKHPLVFIFGSGVEAEGMDLTEIENEDVKFRWLHSLKFLLNSDIYGFFSV